MHYQTDKVIFIKHLLFVLPLKPLLSLDELTAPGEITITDMNTWQKCATGCMYASLCCTFALLLVTEVNQSEA